MEMAKLVLYVMPDSELCEQAEVLLRVNGFEYRKVDVTKEPFDQWVYGLPILDTPEGYKVGVDEIREYIEKNNYNKSSS
jgi:cobalamin biosynthesis Co2+ chelatase CbiK